MNNPAKPLGFWSIWALAVGTMIGSGVLLLPTALAPYGLLSFGGWGLGALGATAIMLCFARLATQTIRDGGLYVYVQDAFGDLAGFLMAWGYWVSFWASLPVIAIAFVGYLGVFFPALQHETMAQAMCAVLLIAVLTIVNMRGLKEASLTQIALTVLKLAPLLVIVAAAVAFGAPENLPAFNPSGKPVLPQLAAVTLITLWPFTGFEAAVTNASAVKDPRRTIPRALTAAMFTATALYLSASLAVNLLVPAAQLAKSQAPFADAARALGPSGPTLIAAGALIVTAGALNGIIFGAGQMLMAVAEDGKAPAALAKLNKGGAPYWALLLSSVLGIALLGLNYSRGFIGAYTFLLTMCTALSLVYYVLTALAVLKQTLRQSLLWSAVALFACAYAIFALVGSGWEAALWGGALLALGAPVFMLFKRSGKGSHA